MLDEDQLDYAIGYLGDRATKCKALVQERIEFIVALHIELKALGKSPPRPSDIRSNLCCVMASAKDLRSHIANLDYASLRALRQQNAFQHNCLIAPISDDIRSGSEFEAICEMRDSRLLSILDAITQAPVADGNLSAIEDCFQDETLKQKLGGKSLDLKKKHGDTTSFGKHIFAEKIVRPGVDKLDFSGFSPILDGISKAIIDYGLDKVGAMLVAGD